jgi:hypothetical protein
MDWQLWSRIRILLLISMQARIWSASNKTSSSNIFAVWYSHCDCTN